MALVVAKWAGIILAGCAILFFVLCLALLFAPVRYRIACDTNAMVPLKIRFRFLFPLFYATVRFGAAESLAAAGASGKRSGMMGKKLQVHARIFGIKVFDLDKKKKKEDTKKKKRRKMHSGKKPSHGRHRRKETDAEGQGRRNKETTVERELPQALPDGSKQRTGSSITGTIKEEEYASPKEAVQGKKSIWEKIGNFFQKIKETFHKICDIIKKYMEKKDLEEEDGIFQAIKEKYGMVKQMWEEKESKEFFAISKLQFRLLFRHIRPRYAKGTLQFGTGDPCMTGQLLGFMALFPPLYGRHIQVIPNFEKRCLQADFEARGRIRLYRLLLFGKNWWLTDERRAWKQKLDKAM